MSSAYLLPSVTSLAYSHLMVHLLCRLSKLLMFRGNVTSCEVVGSKHYIDSLSSHPFSASVKNITSRPLFIVKRLKCTQQSQHLGACKYMPLYCLSGKRQPKLKNEFPLHTHAEHCRTKTKHLSSYIMSTAVDPVCHFSEHLGWSSHSSELHLG